MARVRFRVAAYDDPASVRLIARVQAFYSQRYGGTDATPVDAEEFAPPRGLFLLGHLPGRDEPVAGGGWRRREPAELDSADAAVLRAGDAEIKRMWVAPGHRRAGLGGQMLGELERTAAAAGCRRAVLETGEPQPEALAFYRRHGYVEIPRFGTYRESPTSHCFARELTLEERGGPTG